MPSVTLRLATMAMAPTHCEATGLAAAPPGPRSSRHYGLVRTGAGCRATASRTMLPRTATGPSASSPPIHTSAGKRA